MRGAVGSPTEPRGPNLEDAGRRAERSQSAVPSEAKSASIHNGAAPCGSGSGCPTSDHP